MGHLGDKGIEGQVAHLMALRDERASSEYFECLVVEKQGWNSSVTFSV